MILSDRVVLPLTGSTFEPGNAEKVIKEMEDKESAQIALAEYYYFSVNAELCAETVKPYLSHEDIMLRSWFRWYRKMQRWSKRRPVCLPII